MKRQYIIKKHFCLFCLLIRLLAYWFAIFFINSFSVLDFDITSLEIWLRCLLQPIKICSQLEWMDTLHIKGKKSWLLKPTKRLAKTASISRRWTTKATWLKLQSPVDCKISCCMHHCPSSIGLPFVNKISLWCNMASILPCLVFCWNILR